MTKKKINDLALAASLTANMQLETDISGATANKINMQQIFDEIDGRVPNASVDVFTTTVGQTVFTLSSTPASVAGVSFYHAGQLRPPTDYTVVGTTVTWLDLPYTFVAGEEIIIKYNDVTGCAPPVTSVFGRIGNIVAAVSDYDASQVDNDSGVTGATVKDALDTLDSQSGVTSVFGRSGAVTAQLNDYDASEVNNDSGVAGTTVAAALNTLNAAISVTKTIVIYADSGNANYSNRRPRDVAGAGTYRYNYFIPYDFNTLTAAYIVLYPTSGAAGSGKDIDLHEEHTNSVGQSNVQYTSSDTTTVYNLGTVDTRYHLDVSPLLVNLAAGTDGGILVDTNAIGGTIHTMCMVITYT